MKKLWIFAVLLMAAFILSACSDKEPQPDERFQDYVKLWNKQDFEGMYGMLSEDAKKQIDKKTFVKRYKDIYSGVDLSDLKVSFKAPEEDDEKSEEKKKSYAFSVHMKTIAGPVDFKEKARLVKETRDDKANWYVDWSQAMIFPQLKEPGDEVRVSTTKGERGEIFDAAHNGLAVNGTATQIGFFPKDLNGHKSDTLPKLSKILGVSEDFMNKQLNQSWVNSTTFVPVKTVPSTADDTITQATDLPGVITKDQPARVYPCGEACSHLVGYAATVTAEDLKKHKGEGYTSTSTIGKKGLEAIYESKLKPTVGATIYVRDKNGEKVDTIAEQEPKDGEDIQVTIDSKVQKTLYSKMSKDDNAGTAAAINPQTGAVLALVSTPGFDPNQFALGISSDAYKKLTEDKQKPLLNRFSSNYAPGSSIKPLVAAAALKEGTITPDFSINVDGLQWQKDDSWGDYKISRTHDVPGKDDLEKALIYSDNIYFARVAMKMGEKNFMDDMKAFGFGEKFKFAYPLQNAYIDKDGNLKDELQLANSGYGQGQVQITALQLASAYSIFTDNGSMIMPHLLASDKTSYYKKDLFDEKTISTLDKYLKEVVHNKNGTAYNPQLGLPLAGKTGTAEINKTVQGTTGDENGWFVGYDTKDKDLLIAMMIEHTENRGGSAYTVGLVKKAYQDIKK